MKERFGAALLCDLHSMPPLPAAQAADIVLGDRHGRTAAPALVDTAAAWRTQQGYRVTRNRPYARSEEHTSELQSLMRISYAVFCLKKKIQITKNDSFYESKQQHRKQRKPRKQLTYLTSKSLIICSYSK